MSRSIETPTATIDVGPRVSYNSDMNLTAREMLLRLGRGETIAAVCAAAGSLRNEFDEWWRAECSRRVPDAAGTRSVAGLRGRVRIVRDERGVPHVDAENNTDLFFGFGYAVGQDRLFQLDYQRRKAHGRLAEILGPEAVNSDLLYRTVGVGRIAEAEWTALPADMRPLLAAYADGVNALLEHSRGRWPIEFDLLDYEPEPWSPVDCLAIIGEFRWYLTGRFPVIVVPELVKRALGDGPLYRAFLAGEVDDECILPASSYRRRDPTMERDSVWRAEGVSPPIDSRESGASQPPLATQPRDTTRRSGPAASGSEGLGSNNWVLSADRTDSGRPLVASDPHVPFGAVSLWHEVHLRGGDFNVAGVALTGMPAVLMGRNARVAWGVTNNICSQRDLYQERTDPAHPGCFLFDGQWYPAQERIEEIHVRGTPPIRQTVRSSRHGPLVADILPPAANGTLPVSLRWLGAEPCGWLTALIGMNRARSADEFRAATRPWSVPTFSVVFADVDGQIGFQCTGRLPLRRQLERGYRLGWDREHEWQGIIPFESMPQLADPQQGFVVSANNRVAPDDFHVPLSGTWATGYRARRLRQQIEMRGRMRFDEHRALQLDVYSGRAAACLPSLLRWLADESDERVRSALVRLRAWNCEVTADSTAAAIFNLFFQHWCRQVVAARLATDVVEFVAPNAGGLAVQLLADDALGWFEPGQHVVAVRAALHAALDELTARCGVNMDGWQWGRLHVLLQKHFLSERGELGQLLDRGGLPLGGDGHTVNSSTPDANHAAWLGASYRMLADLADARHGLWSIDVAGQSGHPGSKYYDDQRQPWHRGELRYLPLDGDVDGATLTLEPAK